MSIINSSSMAWKIVVLTPCICRLDRQTEELEKIVIARTSSGEMKTKFKLEELGKRIKQYRTKTVRDVVSISGIASAEVYFVAVLCNFAHCLYSIF